MVSRITTDDGVALWCRSVGSGSDVVLVPGAVVDADLERLATTGRQAVFFDSRNRGRSARVSDPAQAGFWREVADIEVVRSELGFETVALVGWSYVALVVARYALENPVRVTRQVLIAPPAPRSLGSLPAPVEPDVASLARLDQLQADGLDQADPVRWCEEWRGVWVGPHLSDPSVLQRFRSRPCEHPNEWPSHAVQAVAHVLVDLGSFDWTEDLGHCETPTLVLAGDLDQGGYDAAAEWVSALPGARLLALAGCGRFPWVEHPDRFFDAVGEFLGGGWPAGARR